MAYEHDMSQESEKTLLPEGWKEFEILECKESIAKSSGNEMFVFKVSDCKSYQEKEVYATAVKKKRWFLKSILAACGVEAAQDGIYKWDIPDVIGKIIEGRVEHYPDKWTNRENKEVTTIKWKIVEFRVSSIEQSLPKPKERKLPF